MCETQIIRLDPITERDEWLALRSKDVTASVSAALFGVSPFKTKFELWHEKAGFIQPDPEENAAMIRGRIMEGPALQLLREERPDWEVFQPGVYLRKPDLRLGATPDAYATRPDKPGMGVVQVKTTSQGTFRRKWVDENGDVEPPIYVVIQTIHEAFLAGMEWACVVVMVMNDGLSLHVIDVPIHKGIIDALKAKTAEFWASIEAGTPPEPDYGADADLIAALYRNDNGEEIDLSSDNMLPELLAERERLQADARAAQSRIKEIDAEIAHKMGDFERAYLNGWVIKRPLVKRKGFYVEPTEYRRLTIKKLD